MQFKARIKKLASENNIPAQAVLQNFMLERLLERISQSTHKDKLILKGGMLIASLVGVHSRTTMDMDTTLKSHPLSEEALRQTLSEICAIELDDGVIFSLKELKDIRDTDDYGGYRAAINAQYETINTPLKIDITVGDKVTPEAIEYAFPSIFEEKNIAVWAYNIETVLAEKAETILRRGIFNTRSRDFYDIYILSKTQRIDKELFIIALNATAKHRSSLSAIEKKAETLKALQDDTLLKERWERYCKDNYYAKGISFDEVIEALEKLLS
ncbi:MAG: nucleotidyl transferase AbiEii/AbiGii toxin family protein [Chloroflexi bacterium]|nr:nucleotidyl transferase AbiEii/AbiGii toxin family protein [Chloroflexota bacterium]